MTRDIEWMELDPTRADYRARLGAYIGGHTCLQLPGGSFAIVGHMTCGTRESCERNAADLKGEKGDRVVSRATLLSWAKVS